MSKKKISDYVFQPGVGKNSNLFPDAYWLIENNLEYIKAEANGFIAAQITADTNQNLRPEAVRLLTANKTFLQDELTAWIGRQVTIGTTRTPTAINYAPATGIMIVTIGAHTFQVGDVIYFAPNSLTFTCALDGNASQKTYPRASGAPNASGTDPFFNRYLVITAVGATTVTVNVGISSNTSTHTFVSASANAATIGFPGFTYDVSKCKRDVGYVLDAYIYDIRYGGNERSIEVVKQYWLGGVPQVDGSRREEVAAHDRLRGFINDNILPRVAVTTLQSPITSTQNTTAPSAETGTTTLITGLTTIVADTIKDGLSVLPATVYSVYNFAGYVYDTDKCSRDVGYVLDAYLHDLRYGGNVNTSNVASRYWDNGVAQVDGDRTPETVTHTFIRELIKNSVLLKANPVTSYQIAIPRIGPSNRTAEIGSSSRIDALAGIIINVITNGISNLPTLEFGVTTVKIQGKYALEDILLITNASDSTIIFNFGDPNLGANISYFSSYNSNGNYYDADFPTFLQTSDSITTLYLAADTATASATDNIQIFVEEENQTVRPFDFGTDAIERMRVAQPQSMLDADFEYGLQPTKWQAIGVARGYPSVYEVPGTDTPVNNVVTDASTGSGGVGESLITVTTQGPHGFTIGTPITIKALANTISGFSRAEGTFIINSVPTTTSFTYYATAKVGTLSGQVLAGTYTQLRKAAFYTGANIGSPTISVLSNGTNSTFTTKFITGTGTDQIAMTGTMPPTGAPVTGTGIGTGSQITGTVGPGGASAVVTPLIETNVTAGDNSITFSTVSGILEGFGIDNGSGTAIFVAGIVGTTVTFTGPVTNNRTGSTQTYTNVSGANIANTGADAILTISRQNSQYSTPIVQTPGTGYNIGNRLLITGDLLGGATPANDCIATVQSVDGTGGITTFTVSGTSVSSDAVFTNLLPAVPDNTISYTSQSQNSTTGSGTGAVFNVDRANIGYTATLTTAGSGYAVGEQLIFDGTNFGGTAPTNDMSITVTEVTATYTAVLQDATNGGGSGATFDITRTGNNYSVTLNNGGSGHIIGDILTIYGANVGGLTGTNDITITVTGETGNVITSFTASGTAAGLGGISTYNTSGTPYPTTGFGANVTVNRTAGNYVVTLNSGGQSYIVGDVLTVPGAVLGGNTPTNNLTLTVDSIDGNGGVLTYTQAGTSITGDDVFANLSGVLEAANGLNATFDITRSGGLYTIATPNVPGTGYNVGDRITILGTSLGGTAPTNNTVIRVASVSGGAITTADVVSGTAITGVTVEFWSAVSVSEVTTASIPDGTTISASAIAKFTATFNSNHGLVPGASVIVSINSSGTNHELAAGPSYVEQCPTPNTFIWTARTTGSVDIVTQISGVIYARPDTFFVHRPFDGGVQLGTGGPQHGVQALRMSKKYIRYQSGKGIMYTTGALFAPSYNLGGLTASGTAVGSFITVVTDDVDHGCQVGAGIRIIGVETAGYNGTYEVTDVINERTLRVQATTVLGNTVARLGPEAQISLSSWHGATVRAGTFDDQNGMFWQYDGQYLSVGRRFSTFQLAGTITIAPDTNSVTGTGTRFRDQVKAGDKVVIRGMTHTVTQVTSDTAMTVNPDFRGVTTVTNAKMCLVQDLIIRQEQFNRDKIDGTGPSGYNVDTSKMQMIGIQWSWYGAGFIDYMLRGSDGNFVFAHRFRTSNVNTEAYMRTGNLPVRYEVINEGPTGLLASSITRSQTTIPLVDASFFPNEAGTVYIDNELIAFSGKSGNTLTGCTRAVPLTNFVGGAQRTFTAGSATTHEYNTGVILISCTTSPIISHWGSAFLTDGRFDEDRGYIFSYAATNISITTTKQTAFLIRLAPSVSNAIVGDLGERELLNRAQLLLKAIEVTSDTGTGGIVIEGVLNPQNYPTNPAAIAWTGLQGSAQGGQPSFAQIAPGGSVSWSTGTTQTTATATVASFPTGTITARALSWRSNRSLQSGSNVFAITETDYNTYVSQGFAIGDQISGGGIPANSTISNLQFWYTDGTLGRLWQVSMNSNANSNINGDTTLTVTKSYNLQSTSLMFFTTASWTASGATTGTEVSDTRFPANTFVTNATSANYFGTSYFRVTFSQTSTATPVVPNTTTITFKFGQPPYALPGETVFSFVAASGGTERLDLSELKELTNTTLGGRGAYPNGPDVMAINVYKSAGTATPANIVLRWGEAQA